MRNAEQSGQLLLAKQSLHFTPIVESILDQNQPSAREHNLAEIKVIVVLSIFHQPLIDKSKTDGFAIICVLSRSKTLMRSLM